MRLLFLRDALREVQLRLKPLQGRLKEDNLLLGVTGYVASGKSHFCTFLRADVEVILNTTIIYLPLDLWINKGMREARRYADRFFLGDLIEAVRCIKAGNRFLVSRYDIMKTIVRMEDAADPSAPRITWNGRSFTLFGGRRTMKQLAGATDFYVDPSTGYLYSMFPSGTGHCYLLDGTLIVPPEVRAFYDLLIFVETSWPVRVARMIRRFNRKEVFGATQKSMRDYVGFLVKEARECTDEEIRSQIDSGILRIASIPDTLSNYLDLAYLCWLTELPDTPDWVRHAEAKEAMRTYLEYLRGVHDAETISRFRQELAALMESKHLLALPDAVCLLSELAVIVH
ncbi:hypothetical protein HZA56_11910 [Candidatus Poribacteria bacterium]|nr:hypothetical protein [Candidatus Poribacteria bacterium]